MWLWIEFCYTLSLLVGNICGILFRFCHKPYYGHIDVEAIKDLKMDFLASEDSQFLISTFLNPFFLIITNWLLLTYSENSEVPEGTFLIMHLQMIMQALQILCWLIFYFYPFLPTEEDPWYGTKIQDLIRYRSKHITYACVVLYNQVIPVFGVLSYLVIIIIRSLEYGFKDVEKGEIWLWVSLYPLICITIAAYYQFKLHPEIVKELA